MLVSGIIGKILRDIPIVVICILIASLIECFLILPGHLRESFHRNHHKPPSAIRARLDSAFDRFRDRLFRPLSEWTLQHRGLTLITTVCLMVLTIGMVASGHVRFTFFPTPEGTSLVASVKFAAGTPPSEVKAFGRTLEDRLWAVNDKLKTGDDLVNSAVLQINQGSFDGGRSKEQGEQYAMVTVQMSSPDSRSVRNTEFIKAWRKALPHPAGLEQLSITSPEGGPPGRAIDLFLTGADVNTLKKAAEYLQDQLRGYAGVTDILDDLPWGKQQYIFSLTPAAQALGMTISDIGRQMHAAFDGQLLQVLHDAHDEIEVRIMLPKGERELQRTLDDLPIITPDGKVARLSNMINLRSRRGVELLRHTDGKLGVHVTADVDSSVTNANQVLSSLRESVVPDLISRYGVQVAYKGKAEEQQDTNSDMGAGALLGLMMIYIILAWVFGAYTWPLAVMVAIPFGLCGAIFGHWLLGLDLTILSMFGMFGLSGIVINDSIILVTLYKELRENGMPVRDALSEAAAQRLRAVLLTSLTTIGGLMPLLFETSLQAQFLIPMAVSLSFGLAVGTLLVLLVIPVLLSVIESVTARLKPTASAPEADHG